ncbi:hypothetical protein MMC10_005833, partial [Thelotrema lepadinum]|nr:hypothetical protein [Thelotrema lepadinum]
MLGPVLSKAARRKSVPRLCSSLSISPPSNIGSRYSPAALDQCRKSSSKPSSPPNDDAPPVAAPTDAPKRKQTFSKMGRTKPKEGSAKIVSSPPSSQPLPSVPSTQHLQRQ